MKKCIQANIVIYVMELLTGEKTRSIEAARHLIASPSDLDPELLAKVVTGPGYKLWSKIMSAYVLGFVPIEATSKHQLVLRQALADYSMNSMLRTHAAEALGNLRDAGAAELLKDRLLDEREHKNVRRWCIYALSELGTSSALMALKNFALTNPRGALAEELHAVDVAS